MSRRDLAREVLDDQELAEYEAMQRTESRPMLRRGGIPRINSDGFDHDGDFHGVPGHWDDWKGLGE